MLATGMWDALARDFADLHEPGRMVDILVRLLVAALLGGLLGYQREKTGKAAGLRTHILVAAGAALFVCVPHQDGMTPADLSRIIQGIVAGIGFLGAGAIMKRSEVNEIHGLTTAASIWLTAAVGVAVGLGRLGSAIVAAVFAYVVLEFLRRLAPPPRNGDTAGGNK